jgi:hypothetical protein
MSYQIDVLGQPFSGVQIKNGSAVVTSQNKKNRYSKLQPGTKTIDVSAEFNRLKDRFDDVNYYSP